MLLEGALERDRLTLRPPHPDDGARMWRLVRDMGGLELNSAYFYLLYCRDYAGSCQIAEADGDLAGFVLGHRPPERPTSLFVWQIGVAPRMRQRGVGLALLQSLIRHRTRAAPWVYLEASVSPDNRASRQLFRSLAERHQVRCEVSPFLSAEQFPETHPREDLLRIGPFPHTERQTTP